MGLSATDKSIERQTNALMVFVFMWHLLTIPKILNIASYYNKG